MRVRTAGDIAIAARRRRTDLGLTQHALAEAIGASRKWVADCEAGKPTAEIGLVLSLLEALDLLVDLRERPARPIDLDAMIGDA